MQLVATSKASQNEAFVDPWTVVHFAAGLALGLMRAPPGPSMAAAVAYEGFEQVFERTDEGKSFFVTSGPESPGNVVVDLGVYALGYYLGTRWR
jgi:hypothetical protein